ncbi:hypothetical protein B1R27_36600 [Streptomyces sp. GKU 895]|nr:hypothetical protein B1R27_36600 [Streptomyces sp. GKU 895]
MPPTPGRGFRAHLTALRDGEVTSGAVKLFGISIAALLAGAVLKEKALDKVLAGVVTAGAAHFVNLVDVRPGRAAAVVIGLGVPGMLRKGPGGELAAAAVGAAAAVLPGDLGEWSMLGDTGAHALGAVLGVAVAVGNGRAGLVAHAATVVAAAVCGDRVTGVARRVRGQWCRGFGPWGGFGGVFTRVSDPTCLHPESAHRRRSRNTRTCWHPWGST